MEARQKNKEMEHKFMMKDKKKVRKEDLIRSVLPTDDIDKIYDNEHFFDEKKEEASDAGDSDLYEENDDDYDE